MTDADSGSIAEAFDMAPQLKPEPGTDVTKLALVLSCLLPVGKTKPAVGREA